MSQPDIDARPRRVTASEGRIGVETSARNLVRGDDFGIGAQNGRTIVAVYRPLSPDQRTTAFSMGRPGTAGEYLMLESSTFNSIGGRFGVYATNNAYDSPVPTATVAPAVHAVVVDTMEPGTALLSALSCFIDGQPQPLTRTFSGLGTGVIEPLQVDESTIGPPTGAESSPAHVHEVLLYDRPLTAAELDTLERDLRGRHGL